MFSDVHGDNFFDYNTRLQYVVVKGGSKFSPVEIRTSPGIVVSFDMPALTVDEFFEENLIDNLIA